jgi:D-sedoheptulose 7-phosphate isomerase
MRVATRRHGRYNRPLMDTIGRITRQFQQSAQLKLAAAEVLAAPIAAAIDVLASAVSTDRKLLICGNGGSAADSQHFAAELVGRFERERPELAAIALTTDSSILSAIANDYAWDQVFAKQVRALGQAGDVLVAISTSGNSPSVLHAAQAARDRGMRLIALTGRGGGRLGEMLGPQDVHLCVPHDRTARIQEVHLLMIHCLCDGLDAVLLGESEDLES